jgi:small subunit ribosomal protein S23
MIPLTQAYTRAIAQFRSLRSEHHIATTFAAMEADAIGAVFAPGEIEHAFEKETKGLITWERKAELDEGAIAARKRWKAIVEKQDGVGQWTKGEKYVRLWREGVRPTYSPALTEPVTVDALSAEQIAESADFMQTVPR